MQYFFGYVGVLCVGLSAAVFAANPSFSDAQKRSSICGARLSSHTTRSVNRSKPGLTKKQQQRMQEEVQKAVKVHAKPYFKANYLQ